MASETVDISTEYLAWDNVETVYCTYNIDGEPQPRKPITYALRVNPRDRRDSPLGVRTSSRDVTFWLPVAEFGTKEPDGNMVIEDSSQVKYSANETNLVRLGDSKSHWIVRATRYQDEP